MTTETDRARPRSLGRIDPALRDAAASLDIVEFRAESFNTPNTVILGTPNGNVLDPNFGKDQRHPNRRRSDPYFTAVQPPNTPSW